MPTTRAHNVQPPERRRGFRRRTPALGAAALSGALALAGLAGTAAAAAAQPTAATSAVGSPSAATGPHPGLIGVPLAVANQGQFAGYDVAMNRRGTAYVGWISAAANDARLRTVHLCVIPAGALACAGGVQSTPSFGPSSAEGLRVLVYGDGQATLVWFHDTSPGSVAGPRGGRIAEALVSPAGRLGAALDVADAPSFGSMLDAEIGPDQKVWTVAARSSGGGPLEVRDGRGPVANVAAPWPYVAYAALAFAGRTPILAVTKAGAITTPVAVASRPGGAWTRFRAVGGTWTVGTNIGLTATPSGVRLVAAVNNADYFPVVSRWTGSGFTRPTRTGDTSSCAPSSHGTATDASGRLVDVSIECGQIAVANLQDTARASIVRFSTRGTTAAGTPRIASMPSGRAIVAWTVETSNRANPDRLYIGAVRLGGLTVSRTKAVRGGRVTVTGPVSCLPAVVVPLGVKGRPAAGWHVAASSLRLNGKVIGARTLNGAALTPGARFTLTALVTFARGSARAGGSVGLVFHACGRP